MTEKLTEEQMLMGEALTRMSQPQDPVEGEKG